MRGGAEVVVLSLGVLGVGIGEPGSTISPNAFREDEDRFDGSFSFLVVSRERLGGASEARRRKDERRGASSSLRLALSFVVVVYRTLYAVSEPLNVSPRRSPG